MGDPAAMQESSNTESPDASLREPERVTPTAPRILIGGAPFGPNHLGNEASLESVVHIIREISPESEIYASTAAARETEKRLGIMTQSPIGFSNAPSSSAQTGDVLKRCDVFIWIGSTECFEDPEIPLQLLATAQQFQIPSFVFCADLTPQIHPTFFPPQSKTQRTLFNAVKFLSAGIMDLDKDRQNTRNTTIRKTLEEVIPNASFIATRDRQDKIELEEILEPSPSIHLGTDPAIALSCPDLDTCRFPKQTKDFIEQTGIKIGICFEKSSENRWLTELVPLLKTLLDKYQVRFVGIPMQADSHRSNLEEIQHKLQSLDSMHILPSGYDPDEIAAAVSRLDLVLSDQRDLLVLASITLTPFLGIGGGPRISNFTHQFDLPNFSNTESRSVDDLRKEVEALLNDREAFRKRAKAVRIELLTRLKGVKEQLRIALQTLHVERP